MTVWATVLLAGVVSYLIRVLPVAVLSDRPIPGWLERVGPLTAPVAFAALGAAMVASSAEAGAGVLGARLVALVVAAAVAHVTRSATWTLAVGMGTLWGCSALV